MQKRFKTFIYNIMFHKGSSRHWRNECAIFQNKAYDTRLFYKAFIGNLVPHVQGNYHREE